MLRDHLLTVLRWTIGLVLLWLAWELAIRPRDEETMDVTKVVLGAVVALVALAFLWSSIFRFASKPIVAMVDAVFSPGGELEKPLLNLKLPSHYLNEGRHDEALAEYWKVIKHYPKEAEAYEKAIWLESEIFQRKKEVKKLLKLARRRGIELDHRIVMRATWDGERKV